jgi:hypothetical protein
MGDQELAAKYQKLATAYAELKQKNAVLKNAVQDLSRQQQQQGSSGGSAGACVCVCHESTSWTTQACHASSAARVIDCPMHPLRSHSLRRFRTSLVCRTRACFLQLVGGIKGAEHVCFD